MLALVQCEIDITGPVIAGTYRAVANLLNMKQTFIFKYNSYVNPIGR